MESHLKSRLRGISNNNTEASAYTRKAGISLKWRSVVLGDA